MKSPAKTIKKLVEDHFWPETIEANVTYSRQHDDTDGEPTGHLLVTIDKMGDVYVGIDAGPWLRFRTWGGGGRSHRTRTALTVLAEAIRLDNEEDPK